MSSHFFVGLLIGVFLGLPSGIFVEKNGPTTSLPPAEGENVAGHLIGVQQEEAERSTIVQQCSDMDSMDGGQGACPLLKEESD